LLFNLIPAPSLLLSLSETAPTRLEEILDFVPHTPQPFIVEIRRLEKSREEQDLLDNFRANKTNGEDGLTPAP
jgi:hypothetical protein